MEKWWKKFYQNNKAIIWAGVVSLLITAGVLLKVKDEVTRFTLIMPVFAGFILFSILITSDEELEGEEIADFTTKKTVSSKKTKK